MPFPAVTAALAGPGVALASPTVDTYKRRRVGFVILCMIAIAACVTAALRSDGYLRLAAAGAVVFLVSLVASFLRGPRGKRDMPGSGESRA